LVLEHYPALGFTPIEGAVPGHKYWELRIDDQWTQHPHFIRENSPNE
jgi:hypothetical protein